MSARRVLLLILAVIVASGTAVFTRSAMKTPPSSTASAVVAVKDPASETVEVLVAARDLPSGTLMRDTDIKWAVWPKNAATDVFAVKGKKDIPEFVGTVVRQGMRMGEPLLEGRLVRKGDQGFLASVLMPGMRAMTIPVTPSSSVAGLAFPGDRVDVVVTHKVKQRSADGTKITDHWVSETMLTDVRVLALDQKTNDQSREVKIAQLATLEVSPRQAENLALINELGSLLLVLRSVEEPDTAVAIQPNANPNANPDSIALPQIQNEKNEKTESENFVWDSDISKVLPQPADRRGRTQHIQILRGSKEAVETTF